jgi:hypothetical protein
MQKPSSVSFKEHHARAIFTYTIQDFDYVLEIANMEGGQGQFDVAKVAIAQLGVLPTGCAGGVFPRDAHARVHRPVGRVGALVIVGGGEVVDIAVRHFESGLVDDVFVGTRMNQSARSFYKPYRIEGVQYAKLDVLDARGDPVHNLLFGMALRRRHIFFHLHDEVYML